MAKTTAEKTAKKMEMEKDGFTSVKEKGARKEKHTVAEIRHGGGGVMR